MYLASLEKYTIDGDHLGVFFKNGPLQIAEKLNAIMDQVNKSYNSKQASPKKALNVEGQRV